VITDDLHSLTGVYALDALEADEAAAFEAHLPMCPACRQEVAELQEVAGALALVTLSPPPDHVRTRIFEALGAPRREPPAAAAEPPSPASRPGARSAGGRRRRPLAVVVVAAAAALLVLGIAGVRLATSPSSTHRQGAVIEDVMAAAAAVQGADTTTIPLEGPAGASGQVRWSSVAARGYLTFDGLPSPGPGQAYELWYVDGSPRPGPVFAPGVTAVPILDQGVRAPATFAVTIEPEGGVATPTGPVVLSGGTGR